MSNICPTCGQPLQRPGPPWKQERWQTYNTGADIPAAAPGTTWTRREPSRAPTSQDVTVPLAYSAITGLAFGSCGVLVALWQHWPWYLGIGVAVVTFAITWLLLVSQWRDMLWRVEEIVGVDLDADHQVGQPEPQPQLIRLEVSRQNGRSQSFIELVGISEPDLLRLARLALQDNLNQRSVGLSREVWQRVRDELLARGLLQWRDDSEHRLGVVATDAGRQAFESLLALSGR